MQLLFLDTETTGNDVAHDRLCQVCFKVSDLVVNELFKPPHPISVKAMSITHITNEMVASRPPFQGSATHQQLAELLTDHIMVAHNAAFDISILEAEGLVVPRFICTLKMARWLDAEQKIPEYNLQFLRYYLGLTLPDARPHDAHGDVLVLEAVFAALHAQAQQQLQLDEAALLEKLLEISTQPSLIHTLPFGKYRGTKLAEIAQRDPGYLDWLLQQKETQVKSGGGDPRDQDLLYSLRYFRTHPA